MEFIIQEERSEQDCRSTPDQFAVQNSFKEDFQADAEIPEVMFQQISDLLTRLRKESRDDQLNTINKYIVKRFKTCRHPTFTFEIMRLLAPDIDRERFNYGLRQKGLAVLICSCLGIKEEDFYRLYHYRHPSYHFPGQRIRDFSTRTFDITKDYFKKTSTLTVHRLNQLLEQLVHKNQKEVLTDLISQTNAQEFKWIIRIILKDLKLGIKGEVILFAFHPDAVELYGRNPNLQEICNKFENPEFSLSDQVRLFQPVKPMLAGRKKIDLFRTDPRLFYIETKFYGQRLQAHIDKEQIRLYSRNGIQTPQFQEAIAGFLRDAVQADACILDGQIIIFDSEDKKTMPFSISTAKAVKNGYESLQLCYKIFDILLLRVKNEDIILTSYPLKQRKKLLQKVIPEQIPGRVELVGFREIFDWADIIKYFNASLEQNEEGVMLKDPDSSYIPKERGSNWLKLKADYVDGLSESIDVVILGVDKREVISIQINKLGSHNQSYSFLVGVLESPYQGIQMPYAIPFAIIDQQFTAYQIKDIEERINDNLSKFKEKQPAWLHCKWNFFDLKQDYFFIKDLTRSVILEVKGLELIPSSTFPTGCTLRSGKNLKVKLDKIWSEAMGKNQLNQIYQKTNSAKNIKEKRKEYSDCSKSKKFQWVYSYYQPDFDNSKPEQKAILAMFRCVDVTKEPLVSHLFHNKQFTVFDLIYPFDRQELERDILLNGGRVVELPLNTTQYIVTDLNWISPNSMKWHYLDENKEYIFVEPRYIKRCIKSMSILPQLSISLACLPSMIESSHREAFDKFGDSYTDNISLDELEGILSQMDQDYPINEELIARIGIQKKRSSKITYFVDISQLDQLELRRQGNRSSYLQGFPNSFVVSRQCYQDCLSEFKQYIAKHNAQVQIYEDMHNSQGQLI